MSAATTSEWHGIAVVPPGGDQSDALHIGPLPGRKQIALYLVSHGRSTVLAYFRDEESARRALAWIDYMSAFVGWMGSNTVWPDAPAGGAR